MSDEMAARVATQSQARLDQEAALKAAIDILQLRQWCVDKALQACGTEGVTWHQSTVDTAPYSLCAVVDTAEEILQFITGGEKT